MDIQQYPKAFDSYQQTIYCAHDFPGYWTSIGLLYFAINQFRDSLDAFVKSISTFRKIGTMSAFW